MPQFYGVRVGQVQQVVASVAILKDQPHIVSSLVKYYETLPKTEYAHRLRTLEFIGELQRTDALPFLQAAIWEPLPEGQPLIEGLSTRDLEEILRVKCVHGVSYLRTTESRNAAIDIMLRHESTAVRIAAIDSYMWNSNDSQEEAKRLYALLPQDLHMFIEQPRFHFGVDRQEFNTRLRAWREKWGKTPGPR